jgi:hypothetical protein
LALKAKWKDGNPGGLFMPLKDGDAKFNEDEVKYAHYKGRYYMNLKTRTPPKVVDSAVKEITDPTVITSGDHAKVSVNFRAFDVSGNKGVGAYLNAVQWLGKGPVVIGGSDPGSDFGVEEVAETF